MNNYVESKESKKLIELNGMQMDIMHSNKYLQKITKRRGKLGQIKRIFFFLAHLPSYGFGKVWLAIKVCFSRKVIKNYELEYDFDHEKEFNYLSTGKQINGKIAVYTSIFGGYDALLEPMYVSENCDYYAITDLDIPEGSVWKKLDLSHVDGFDEMDGYHKSKYCKLHPHVLFPEHDYSIWVDGNVQIVGDLYPLVDRMDDSHVMETFENPIHNCIYTEKNFLIYMDAVNTGTINNQIGVYQKAGFPKKFGMREFTIIVRKHHDEELKSLMGQWWEHCNTYSMRDQISMPYILWKNDKTIDYIQLIKGNWRYNPRFVFVPHSWRHSFKK